MSALNANSELKEAVRELRPFFIQAAVFSLVTSLLVLGSSWYMLEVYERVVNSRNHMTLLMLTLAVLMVYAVMEVLEWARSGLMHEAGDLFDARMRSRFFKTLFEANLKRIPGGSLQTMNDFRAVKGFMTSPALFAVMETPASLVFLVLIFSMNPWLGAFTLVSAVVQVVVALLNEKNTQPPLSEANKGAFAAQQYADGVLRNAQVIESMGMLGDVHRRWIQKQRHFLGLQTIASLAGGFYQSISKFLQNVVSSALLGLGCWALLHEKLNGGPAMMIIASVLGGRVLAPLVQVVAQWQGVVNARDAWARLEQLLKTLPVKPESMSLPAPKGNLQVEGVLASAPGSQAPILRGVSFSLRAGEVLAVVGPSASGKTTLARLLMGLWPSVGGKVRLDGADVFAWDKAELGPHVGYLPQGVELFDGSIAENIARFGDVDQQKVQAAAQAVGLHDFITDLPQGYDSTVGREGMTLSGGQRQRVGLARALYGEPVFVVLDEPNSSLDDVGDAALAGAIQVMKAKGTTFVVMTHRTSVLAVADKMLLLRDGQVQAFGPRDEVLAALNKAVQQANDHAQPKAAAVATTPISIARPVVA